jgi:hypothetical protein
VRPNTDKYVRVLNKGWYIARLQIRWKLGSRDVSQSAEILAGQQYTFTIPYEVNVDGVSGIVLIADAVAGKRIMEVRVKGNPQQCYHIWGTTLFPAWSPINC